MRTVHPRSALSVTLLAGFAIITLCVGLGISQQRRGAATQRTPQQARKITTAETLPDGDYEGTFLIFRKRGKTAVGSSFNGLQNICVHGTFTGNAIVYDRAVRIRNTYKNGDWVLVTEDRLSEYGGYSFDKGLPQRHFVGRDSTPDTAFGACWKLFGPENEKSEWSSVTSPEKLPDAIYGASDGYHYPEGLHYYRKDGRAVTGFYSAHDGVRACYQGELSENIIVVRRAVGFEEFNYDSGKIEKFKDLSKNEMRVKHYNEFTLIRPGAVQAGVDKRSYSLLAACAGYFGSPIASSCVPPQHRLVFVGKDGRSAISGGSGTSTGQHAYVIWETYSASSHSYRQEAWGWYPRYETPLEQPDDLAIEVFFGTAVAVVKPDPLKPHGKGILIFRIPVSEATYQKTLAVKETWSKAAHAKTMKYSLFKRDCADFVNSIAQAVGDDGATVESNSGTGPLNIPKVGRPYTDPAKYVIELTKLNADRAVPESAPECDPNAASQVPQLKVSSPASPQQPGQPKDSKQSQTAPPQSQKEKAKKALKGIWDKVKNPG